MADSSGTWLKLGYEKWQFIPEEVKEQASKLDLTWEGAAVLTKFCRPNGLSKEALIELGEHASGVSLKPRHATEGYIDHVELTPRRGAPWRTLQEPG